MSDTESAIRRQLAEQVQETFASALNAVTWALLRQPDRSVLDDEKMLYAAFASAYHYLETGTFLEHQRAEWLISRVYAALGNGPEALHHAERCMALTTAHRDQLPDFDKAFALEALARAHAKAGNTDEAAKFRAEAEQAGNAISDEQSRKVFLEELNT
jgi:hypothetical protein